MGREYVKDLIFPALGDGNLNVLDLRLGVVPKDLIFPALGDGNQEQEYPNQLN